MSRQYIRNRKHICPLKFVRFYDTSTDMSAFRKLSPKTSPVKLIADGGETCISHTKKRIFFSLLILRELLALRHGINLLLYEMRPRNRSRHFNLGHLGYCFNLTFINSDAFVTKSVSQVTKFNYSIFTMTFFYLMFSENILSKTQFSFSRVLVYSNPRQ